MTRLVLVAALLVMGYAAVNLIVSIRITGSHESEPLNSSWPGRSGRFPQYDTQHEFSRRNGRFPQYGTEEFERKCGYTSYHGNTRNCTFMVQPSSTSPEGISNWISEVARGHLLAQQAGCDFVFDYGTTADVHAILTPANSSHHDWNWTVPLHLDCELDPTCFQISLATNMAKLRESLGNTELFQIPFYRFIYHPKRSKHTNPQNFRSARLAFPDFSADSGMACSLGSLFHLAPKATQFEPDLFSKILFTLHREDSLVMAVYIRTREADDAANRKLALRKLEVNMTEEDRKKDSRERAKNIIECALLQEKQHTEKYVFTRVVWMVVTDSPHLKQWITESYDTTRAAAQSNTVVREIVTTRSRGVHTKPRLEPSTSDFAEALLDWYLIGESDFVVMDSGSLSFGGTAALRTARPVYDATDGTCSRAVPIYETFNATVVNSSHPPEINITVL